VVVSNIDAVENAVIVPALVSGKHRVGSSRRIEANRAYSASGTACLVDVGIDGSTRASMVRNRHSGCPQAWLDGTDL
jgi:hypothetical protein